MGNAGQTAAATLQRRVAGHRGIDRQCCCSGVRSPGEQPQYFRERDREDRAPRALFYSVLSYAGTYSINGNVVTHHVDVSWNEPWTGSDQTRNVRLEGDWLHLSPPPSPDPLDGKLSVRRMVWERVK